MSEFPQALAGIAELRTLVRYLQELEILSDVLRVSVAMVRGLEYYTGPVFETTVEEPRIGSITGGGRYDGLVGLFSRESIPATGTSLGIERIIDVMEELEMYPPGLGSTVVQVLVVAVDEETEGPALRLARDLRRAGWSAEVPLEQAKIGKQIRYALKKGIPAVALVGPDEVARGTTTLRNLQTREQVTVPQTEAISTLAAWRDASA